MQLRLDPNQLDDAAHRDHQGQDPAFRHLCFVAGGGRQPHRPRPGQARQAEPAYTQQCLELCGKLGIPNIGGQSGTIKGTPLAAAGGRDRQGLHRKILSRCARRTKCAFSGSRMPADPTSPPARWAGRRCSRRSTTARTSACSSIRRIWSGSSWTRWPPRANSPTKIYDVHLKDTEILWHVVHRAGIQPVNNCALVAFPRCPATARWIGRASSRCWRKSAIPAP